MQIAELIAQKITEGKSVLSGLDAMRERSGMAMNVTYYVSEDVDSARRKINKWQLTSKDILINGFGEMHRYVTEFVDTISAKNIGFNYKREFKHEVNHGLSVLESISESLQLGLEGIKKSPKEKATGTNPPLVFISHAELDKEFANEIVILLEFIGVKDILCTSVDGYRIPLGRDIIEYLRETFNSFNLFVIILHTHNYYTRPVCLNEMGAAWALKTKYFSVLAPDFDFSEMTGVVNDRDVAIKIGAADCESRLNQLKKELVDFFSLPEPNENRWPHYRTKFLSNCLKFKVTKTIEEFSELAKEEPMASPLMVLSSNFRLFEDGDGCYPFQIDVKFASQDADIYFKSITLSNNHRCVELDGYGANKDVLQLNKYLKPNVLDIEYSKNANYNDLVRENYQSGQIYVEDHKLAKEALETMSFHGIIGLRRQMDGYEDFEVEGWELCVSYNINGKLTIPLNVLKV